LQQRLIKKLSITKIGNNQDMKTHLDNLAEIYSDLEDVDHQVSDYEKAITMLTSLSDDYTNIVTAISAWEPIRINVGNVRNMLIDHFENTIKTRRAVRYSTSNDSEFQSSCAPSSSGQMKDLECGYCHRLGHIKKSCYKLAYVRQQQKQDDKQNSKWYVDSASTAHISNNINGFTSLDEAYRSKVKGISGFDLEVVGIGTYKLNFSRVIMRTIILN
jgi:hypothetical protein